MLFELAMFWIYRAMALVVAAMMVWVLFRKPGWQVQFFAMLVLIPFALRAAGVK